MKKQELKNLMFPNGKPEPDEFVIALSELAKQIIELRKVHKMKYAILQLNKGEENHLKRFASISELEKGVDDIEAKNYYKVYEDEVYEININDKSKLSELLENIFLKYNQPDKPEDYKGHSLSVSDIILLSNKETGISKAYYCDSWGFITLPEHFVTNWERNQIRNNCEIVDKWNLTYDGKPCTLLQDKEEPEFFYADINGMLFEFDNKPSHQDVENNYIDYIAALDIDRGEKEYGADAIFNEEPER